MATRVPVLFHSLPCAAAFLQSLCLLHQVEFWWSWQFPCDKSQLLELLNFQVLLASAATVIIVVIIFILLWKTTEHFSFLLQLYSLYSFQKLFAIIDLLWNSSKNAFQVYRTIIQLSVNGLRSRDPNFWWCISKSNSWLFNNYQYRFQHQLTNNLFPFRHLSEKINYNYESNSNLVLVINTILK